MTVLKIKERIKVSWSQGTNIGGKNMLVEIKRFINWNIPRNRLDTYNWDQLYSNRLSLKASLLQ